MQSRIILLLNVSNHPLLLIYPYAFVQLSQIAKKYDVTIIRKDLSCLNSDEQKDYVLDINKKYDLDAIFITLRNTDSLEYSNYPSEHAYFPIKKTKEFVEELRTITDLPVVIGGFGFSVLPEKIMSYIQPDFGVFGGADGLFENYDDFISKENLDQIPNLYYFADKTLQQSKRAFYPPADDIEYTKEIIDEILEFQEYFGKKDGINLETSIAVEISRGCPYACIYCSEPLVKGKKVQYRDLSILRQELINLKHKGLSDLFLICSELNPVSNTFSLNFAEMVRDINSNHNGPDISWMATWLMRYSPDEYVDLYKAGFRGGWYDVISLDGQNLTDLKAPYSLESELEGLLNIIASNKKIRTIIGKPLPSTYEIMLDETILEEDNDLIKNVWTLFLGNPLVSIDTVRNILELVDEQNFAQYFRNCGVNTTTRVFDYIGLEPNLLRYTHSFDYNGNEIAYDDLYPSFSYPTALMDHFGSKEETKEFFDVLSKVFLSHKHLLEKDWISFVRDFSDKTQIDALISGIHHAHLFQRPEFGEFRDKSISNLIFSEPISTNKALNLLVDILLNEIFLGNKKILDPLLKQINLPSSHEVLDHSSYQITQRLFRIYRDENELFSSINDQHESTGTFLLRYLFYLKSIPLNSSYRVFFTPS